MRQAGEHSTSQTTQTLIPPVADPYASLAPPTANPHQHDTSIPTPTFNPYPDSIKQSVVHPIGQRPVQQPTPQPQQPVNPPQSTSEKPISPDIISLASNTDLSVETIEREANRIRAKKQAEDEVVISLR